jgi:hypothetical protein
MIAISPLTASVRAALSSSVLWKRDLLLEGLEVAGGISPDSRCWRRNWRCWRFFFLPAL